MELIDTNSFINENLIEELRVMDKPLDEQAIRDIIINGYAYVTHMNIAHMNIQYQENLTINWPEIKNGRSSRIIKKYGEIYSDIKDRFKILDL